MSLLSKQQKVLLVSIILFLVGGLVLAAYLAQKVTRITPKAEIPTDHAVIEFIAEDLTTDSQVGDTFPVYVYVTAPPDPPTNLQSIQTYIQFNSDYLELIPTQAGAPAETGESPFTSWSYLPNNTNPTFPNIIQLTAGNTSQDPAKNLIADQKTLFATIRFRLKAIPDPDSQIPLISLITPDNLPSETFPSSRASDPDANDVPVFSENLFFPTKEPTATPTPTEQPPTATPTPTPPIDPTVGALYLKSDLYEVEAGREFTVDLYLNTGGKYASGVDAIVTYDTQKLEYVPKSKEKIVGDPPAIDSFSKDRYIIDDYLVTQEEPRGRVSVSALISPDADNPDISANSQENGPTQNPVIGQNLKYATLTFKPLAFTATTLGGEDGGEGGSDTATATETTIDFEFTEGDKNDSNIAEFETGKDILKVTLGAVYTITPSKEIGTTLKLKLEVCEQPNNRPTRITYSSGAPIDTILKADNITDPISLPATASAITVRVAGYLYNTFDLTKLPDYPNLPDLINLSSTPLIAGDIDGSGMVNAHDYRPFYEQFNSAEIPPDFDCSGKVNVLDFEAGLRRNWNRCAPDVDNASCKR